MTIEVKVPTLPESVADGVVVAWHKRPGDAVERDEALVDIETDKVVLEVPAPVAGILEEILVKDGETVTADQVMGIIIPGSTESKVTVSVQPVRQDSTAATTPITAPQTSPAVRKLLEEHRLDASRLSGSGKHGRIVKADVLKFVSNQRQPEEKTTRPVTAAVVPGLPDIVEDRPQKRVPMSRLRARVAERMLEAVQATAMLTTFNEVNMKAVMDLRNRHKQAFETNHGVRLGFMSFFVRACAEALKHHPDINASLDGDDIVYHGFCDIGVAISTDRGLVVPILRDTEYMSLAEVEKAILDFSNRGREGKLTMEDITGGTFTITNGGVFGSMLSTPILNPPQSAILGMHKIKERPVVEAGEIVIRPIMYLALTYDHRIVDGKSAVTFLVTIKELLEDPASMLLDL